MSENIIYCYSGTGHCLSMARGIAAYLGDTDIVMMRARPVKTDATEARRVGFVFPCYGGGLPGHVEEYVREIKIAPEAYVFAAEQYAGYLGCGLHKLDEIRRLDYWAAVSNHSTCIWLMPHSLTLPPTSPQRAQERIDRKAMEIGAAAMAMKRSEKRPPKNTLFAVESKAFSGIHGKLIKRFAADGRCIGCGVCTRICPRGNIRMESDRPVFGADCIGCLGCVQYCPKGAIEVGRITRGRERFPNRTVTAEQLRQEIIHVD